MKYKMNTKLLMALSALILGSTGIILSFLPQESAAFLDLDSSDIVMQLLGAAYFGFAMINWTAKANLIGGIYGRPIAIGNFTHFVVASLALIKLTLKNSGDIVLIALSIVYTLLAISYAYVFFTHPSTTNKN